MIKAQLSNIAALLTKDDVNIPLTSAKGETIQDALQLFFAIAGAITMLIIAIGALKYVISRGDVNSIKNAKETIVYAFIGLVVTLTGYGIVTFVVGRL